jgi:integrase
LRLGELVDRFLRDKEGQVADGARAEGTLTTYRRTLAVVQRFFAGNPLVSAITPDHIREYLVWRRTELSGTRRARGQRRETSARTREKDFVTLRTMLNYAVDMGYIEQNPVKRTLRPLPAPKQERRTLSPDEIERLIAACEDRPMLRMWVFLLADTGMRPGEAVALHWEDVDLEAGYITIGRHRPTKTKRMRTVPLSPRLRVALREHFARHRFPHGSPYLLHHLTARRHHRAGEAIHGLSRAFGAAAIRAGLPSETTPYWLRHSFATNLAEAGASAVQLSEFLGHTSFETTKKFYTHLKPEHLRGLVERVGTSEKPKALRAKVH